MNVPRLNRAGAGVEMRKRRRGRILDAMTTARWPELHSIGPTVAVLGALAFVLSHAGSAVVGRNAALKAAKEVRDKANRLFEELQTVQQQQAEARTPGTRDAGTKGPAEIARESEAMIEAIDRMVSGLLRAERAAQMLGRAIDKSSTVATALERIYPGWHEVMGKMQPVLSEFRKEIGAGNFDQRATALRKMAGNVLSRALADQGFDDWAATLPSEAEPLFDEADVQPIHWDAAQGWVEGGR
jgi:hypothetical protein